MILDYDWTEFTRDGRAFAARLHHDTGHGAPWEKSDCHGVVSEWTTRDKRPGERVLSTDSWGRARRYYDVQATRKIAVANGWSAAPHDQGTRRERAARAVAEDFDLLRRWCADLWHYVGVEVVPLCRCCNAPDEARGQSLWGIESFCDDYLVEVAEELADEIIACEAASQQTTGGSPR